MARLPRNASEAVDELGIPEGASVIAIGPDHGYAEALAEAGAATTVVSPPPDLEAHDSVTVADEVAADASADVVAAWVDVVPTHEIRKLVGHVNDEGVLWLVMPKGGKDARVSVTEGELKRVMMSVGWRSDRTVGLSTNAFAVRYRKRG